MPEKPLSELKSHVGDSRRTVERLHVEAGKVSEFAHALRDENPIHHDEAAAADRGFDAIPAPLTFTRTAYFPRYRPDGVEEMYGFDLGFREAYTVHGEQAYEYERPLVVGDVLTGETTLVDVFQRDGRRGGTMTFAVRETAFRDRDGDLVVTARSTAIETGGAIDEADHEDGEETERTRESDDNSSATDATGTGGPVERPPRPTVVPAEVSVGDTAPPLVVEDLERKDFVKYAGASGDFTPIHYDEPYVREAGHDEVFAQGMLTAGYAARMVSDWLGLATVTRFRTRFQSQLFPGESVVVTGEIDSVDRTGAGASVVASFTATTRTGDVILTGEAEADLFAE